MGYVEKTKDIDDNRATYVTLSEKGSKLEPMFDVKLYVSKEN